MTLTFGEWLREARTTKKLSLRDVASQTGLSAGYINKLEHNKQPRPKKEDVERIAHVLGRSSDEAFVTLGWLPAVTEPFDPELIRLKRILHSIPEEKRSRALDAFETLLLAS